MKLLRKYVILFLTRFNTIIFSLHYFKCFIQIHDIESFIVKFGLNLYHNIGRYVDNIDNQRLNINTS